MNSIISFYGEKSSDQNGRFLNDILALDDKTLEEDHFYIQWLFPNKEPSHINLDAPLLTDEVITEFKSHPELIANVKRSLNRISSFLKMDDEHPWWAVKNDHNHLRITRILHSLNAFEMDKECMDFFNKLVHIYTINLDIPMLSMDYWNNAIEAKEKFNVDT